MIDLHKLAGKRVLVTGGHGFIGRPLANRLAALGAEVTAVSRTPHPNRGGVRSSVLDLADASAVEHHFQNTRPQIVLHLASHVVGNRSPDVVLSTYHNNLTSTLHVLLAAQRFGCERVVLTGSLEEPEPDGDWPVPSSPYAAAKMAASAYGRMFHALFDLSVVSLRVFMVYGPEQGDRKKLVPYVITSLARGESPALSSGTRLVDWIYLEDVVEAYLHCAVAPDIDGLTLDAGTGELTAVAEVVRSIYRIMSRPDVPEFGGAADRPMEQIRKADLSRTQAHIGWAPVHNLEEGLTKTVQWYVTHP
jgi:nucleoside-diphosphate-sugar epimerase